MLTFPQSRGGGGGVIAEWVDAPSERFGRIKQINQIFIGYLARSVKGKRSREASRERLWEENSLEPRARDGTMGP